MADDRKRGENLCTRVTERMELDLNRLAAIEQRTLSDFLYVMLRRHLYGDITRLPSKAAYTSDDDVDNADSQGN